ncbi:GNAT family N-acetyltransferase [Hymenobacter sublimis]|uniref:GNAT family N-acetyltransferase n=1 Tax=Hymenobacter sublimis TaxID=2933777 RepID=A0ABY4JDD7_9BACT|nr:GNAT family N-acetyltransferase [Hymenobacter sublimis]UPL49802.1 GNAT family N-acetyltransferase [Hymenobacter sublimis]
MNHTFQLLADLSAESDQSTLAELLHQVFPDTPTAELAAELQYQQNRQPVQVWLAWAEEQLVACKLGYERKPGHYYSWLGGVHPDFRRRGLAQELMQRQHAWCQQRGYRSIRTQTLNRWRAMLLLNLHAGFDIVGTVQGERGLTLVLEKSILPAESRGL